MTELTGLERLSPLKLSAMIYRILLTLSVVLLCGQTTGLSDAALPRIEVETERDKVYDSCDRLAKVAVYIKMEDGSLRHVKKVPYDLICENYVLLGQADPCVYDENNNIVDITIDDFRNMSFHDEGVYGFNSLLDPVFMRLVSFYTKSNHSDINEPEGTQGCNGTMHHERIPQNESWLGLIERGICSFNDKAHRAVNIHKSQGFIVYNHNDPEASHAIMNISVVEEHTSLMVNWTTGLSIRYLEQFLEQLLATSNNTLGYTDKVYVDIKYRHTVVNVECLHSKETQDPPVAVTIVTITFVVVMVVALGWLVIYYFQRHRSANKQEILQLKLQKAARKALSKIGERLIKEQDNPDDDCTYCISPLLLNETIIELPCGHKFHKGCVEEWLIDKRTCPNCQDNILVATKTTIRGIKDIAAAEDEGPATEMTDMAPESRQLLSNTQAIDGYSESSIEVPQWGSQVIPGSQLLTDGQNMFLLVPDHVELPPDSTIQIDNNRPDSMIANQNNTTPISQHGVLVNSPNQQQIIASEQNDNLSIEQTI